MADTEHTLEPSPEIPQKTCTKCHQPFPATREYFLPLKNGLTTRCRECNAKVCRAYYLAHCESAKGKARTRRVENHAIILAKAAIFYLENRERLDAVNKAWLQAHPAEAKAIQQRSRKKAGRERARIQARDWTKKNPTKVRQYERTYRQKSPETLRVKRQRRIAREAGLPGDYTSTQWSKALAYWEFCCAVCEQQADGLFHTIAMDHWIPLTSPACPGTIPTNIVPLCHGLRSCNIQKSNKDPEAWLIEKIGKRKASKKLKEIATFFLFMASTENECD